MKTLFIVGLVAVLASGPALADCVAPTVVADVPNGSTASRDEMLATMQAMKVYNATVATYVDCMRKSGRDSEAVDSAIVRLQKIAERFNAELRAYKTKNGG